MSKRVDINDKLKEINKISKYKYKLIKEYKSNKHKCIEAYCPEHDYRWLTRYNTITTGAKCYYCGIDKNKNARKLNIETIKDNFNFNVKVIGEYINNQTRNIECTCKKCGHKWICSVSKFYRSCSKCREYSKEIERMNKKLDKIKNKFPNLDFSDFKVKGLKDKSIIKCKIHNTVFKKSYANLSYSFKDINVCKKCELEKKEKKYLEKLRKINTEVKLDFIGGFKNASHKNLIFICEKGHKNTTSYSNYLKNHKCLKCHKSKPEIEIVEHIKTFYDKKIIENTRKIIKNIYSGQNLELDIYLPDIKLAIEYNGRYWHSDENITSSRIGFNSSKEYHEYKTNKCKEQGIKLLHIDDIYYLKNKMKILEEIKNIILKKLEQ